MWPGVLRLGAVTATIDPGDFDAFGVVADLVVAVRAAVMERGIDVVATISAPPGRHQLRLVGRPGGHVVLAVRYDDLTLSRRNVLADALRRRGWDPDEDREGATQAAGRLIRTATDRGVVAVLDPRLATAGYRWDVVRALPPMRRTRHREEAEAFLRELRRS